MSNTEIVNGLRAIADFIEDYPIVTNSRMVPTAPLHLSAFVQTKQQVYDIAELEPTEVHTSGEFTFIQVVRGLVTLGIAHIEEPPERELARPVDVTERIAEVEG
jgi:hypothetical protein